MPNRATPPSPKTPALPSRLLRQLRLGDYIVAALFLALGVASVSLQRLSAAHQKATQANVLVRNKIIAELALQSVDTVTVRGTLGLVTLAIAEGEIRVLASSCPNQYCVKQGAISSPQNMLICAPNHLAVLLVSKKENEVDAITF